VELAPVSLTLKVLVNNLCLLVSFSSLLIAQSLIAQEPETASGVVRSTSRLVTVDVVVTESNRPVSGLSKDSFRVLENGKEQEIRNFDVHSGTAASSVPVSEVKLPPHVYSNATVANGPPSVLLLDALNTPVKDQQYLRKEMVSYLKGIPPGTRIAIFTLGNRLRMVQGFTSDIAVLLSAMDSKKAGATNSSLLMQQSDMTVPMDDGSNGNLMLASPQGALDVLDQFQAELTTFQTDLRVLYTLEAMKQLGAFLGSLPGRKNIIWLSGSFPLSLEPDESANNPFITARTYSTQLQQISDEFAADRIAVYPVDVRGVLPPSMFDASGSTAGSAGPPSRRTGRSGGATGFARAQSQAFTQTAAEHATMQQLAEETGGRAFYDTNALTQAIDTAMNDGASYYTLTYSPDNKDFNGKFRKIEVKVSSGKFRLFYRRGYYAQKVKFPERTLSDAMINPRDPAIQHGAPSADQILFKVRVLPADDPLLKDFHPHPGAAGMATLKPPFTRYSVDYSISMREIDMGAGADQLFHCGLELLVIVYDSDGKPLNLVDHPFQLNLKHDDYERLRREGLVLHEEIDVPSGEVYLRLAVHDLTTDRLGSLEVSLQKRSAAVIPGPHRKRIPVKLSKGITGYYMPSTCGAHCDDAILGWTENGYNYSIAIKAGRREEMVKIANSALITK
jgi:VWFA-related protein